MSRQILIVDDEEDVRAIAQLGLEMGAGWNVLTADSGQEALSMAIAHQPDAILLDMMMPDMDGLTTFQKLQANSATRHIPVILLTAKVQAADRLRYAELGMIAAIAKPFNPLQLADQIAAALGWSLEK